jgi:hypothetical protein
MAVPNRAPLARSSASGSLPLVKAAEASLRTFRTGGTRGNGAGLKPRFPALPGHWSRPWPSNAGTLELTVGPRTGVFLPMLAVCLGSGSVTKSET